MRYDATYTPRQDEHIDAPEDPAISGSIENTGTSVATSTALSLVLPANDDRPLRGSADLRLAIPRGGWNAQEEHAAALQEARRAASNASNAVVARFASFAVEQIDTGRPFLAHNGMISCEELTRQCDINMREVAPGTEARTFIENVLQVFVTFPCHLSQGVRLKDPVSAAYAALSLQLTIGRYGQGVSLQWFKASFGVTVSAAKQNAKFKQVIQAALADGRAILANSPHVRTCPTPDDRERQIASFCATVSMFDVPGAKIPGSSHRHGAIDWGELAELAGVASSVADLPQCRRTVTEIAKRRGIAVPGHNYGADLLANLLIELTSRERRRATLNGASDPDQHVAAHRSAFYKILAQSGCTTEDPAAEVFSDERFPALRSAVRASYDNDSSRRNVSARLDRIKAIYDEISARVDPSASFAGQLAALMKSKGLSCQSLAQIAGCSWGTIRNWVAGGKVGINSVPVVARIEEHFGLPQGKLCALARRGWLPASSGTVTSYWYEVSFSRQRLLPREVRYLSEPEIRAAVAKIEHLARDGTDFARISNAGRSDAYRLPGAELPDSWHEELRAYFHYKTARFVAPLKRPKSGIWREETTTEIKRREIDKIVRFLVAPCSDGPNSGLGLDASKATMVWLVVPGLFVRYFAFEAAHLSEVELTGGKRGELFSSRLRGVAHHIKSLTHPETGYLTQHPELAEKLEPLAQTASAERFSGLLAFSGRSGGPLLSQEDVDLAKRDWRAFIAISREAAEQITQFIEEDTPTVRDAMLGAASLIESEEPVANYLSLLFEAESRVRDERSGRFLATDIRNIVMSHLSIVTGFRPKNLVNLKFKGDKPEIFKQNGLWKICVCYRKFKNWKNCGLFGVVGHRLDYDLTITEPFLTKLLDEWFFIHRPLLDDGTCENAFLTKRGKAMTSLTWYEAFRKFGARHIAWNPLTRTGFPGVVLLNPYVHRVLKASDIVNNSTSNDRVQEAAFALQTSEDMIRQHYGLLRSETALRSSYDTYSRAIKIARGKST